MRIGIKSVGSAGHAGHSGHAPSAGSASGQHNGARGLSQDTAAKTGSTPTGYTHESVSGGTSYIGIKSAPSASHIGLKLAPSKAPGFQHNARNPSPPRSSKPANSQFIGLKAVPPRSSAPTGHVSGSSHDSVHGQHGGASRSHAAAAQPHTSSQANAPHADSLTRRGPDGNFIDPPGTFIGSDGRKYAPVRYGFSNGDRGAVFDVDSARHMEQQFGMQSIPNRPDLAVRDRANFKVDYPQSMDFHLLG